MEFTRDAAKGSSNSLASAESISSLASTDLPIGGDRLRATSQDPLGDDDGLLGNEMEDACAVYGQTRKHVEDLKTLVRAAQNAVKEEMGAQGLYEKIVRDDLKDAVFVGHIATDLDSVGGALGAACLFGGIPAISEENLNGEIQFALNECGLPTPTLIDKIPEIEKKKICLVDHTEPKQMTPYVRHHPEREKLIVGVIDHHALAASFSTSVPLFMDLRPWGSMSSIVTALFVQHRRYLPKPIAKILLMAVLSDTLNLKSVTTTDADREVVALLSDYVAVPCLEALASRQFQAKTDWIVGLGPYEMVRGDQKDFHANNWKVGIAVLEVTTTAPVLKAAPGILRELRLLKKEKGMKSGARNVPDELDFAFLFVVDIIEQQSVLLICGGRELALAKHAFPNGKLRAAVEGIEAPGATIRADCTAMDMGSGQVSRKKQFAPAILTALHDDKFECHKLPTALMGDEALAMERMSDGGDEQDLEEEELLQQCQSSQLTHDSIRVRNRPWDQSTAAPETPRTMEDATTQC